MFLSDSGAFAKNWEKQTTVWQHSFKVVAPAVDTSGEKNVFPRLEISELRWSWIKNSISRST